MYLIERYHDISTGHRVYGHESKCAHLHGHNYRIHFTCEPHPGQVRFTGKELDKVGRVMDFSVVKEKLCMWVEENWDHKFLVSVHDPLSQTLKNLDPDGVVLVDFNPTAENMAEYLVNKIGPRQLFDTGVMFSEVCIEETAKCSATYLAERVMYDES